MSLIDLASLVLAPTATKEGKVYSAIPDTGEGDMTFTRGSAATRVNSAGLIEKERGNLLLQSNTFDTTWVNNLGGAITGGQSGYDGSNDAWEINKNTTSFRRLEQSVSVTGIWTFSVYAKAGTREEMALRDGTSGDRAEFNLDSGTIINNGGGTIIERNMTDVGGGWYRCSITCNSTNTLVQIYIDWNKTIGGNIYIQDAMLNQGLVATDYIETTTTAVYEGITDDVPRVDYSGGGCPSLLLEPQRTNLVVQSEYIGSSWNPYGNISVNDNSATSPEGLQNATEISAAATTTAQLGIQDGFSVTANNDYTISFFAKKGDFRYIQLFHGGSQVTSNPRTNFDLEDGVVAYEETGVVSASIENYGNGWYRCIATMEALLTTLQAYITPVPTADAVRGASISATAGDNYYIYGIQLEEGSYVSSYIPTYGTSTSRSADSCSLTGASNLIGQTEGTMFVDFHFDYSDSNTQVLFKANQSTDANSVGIEVESTTIKGLVNSGGGNIATITGTIATGRIKAALAYKTNDMAFYVNGTQVGVDTLGSIAFAGVVDIITIGKFLLNGNSFFPASRPFNEAILFPTRLTNDQLAELTK